MDRTVRAHRFRHQLMSGVTILGILLIVLGIVGLVAAGLRRRRT